MAINTIFFVTTLKLKHRTTPNDEPFGKHRTTPNDEPFGKHRTDQSMYLSEGPCCEKYTIWFSPYESNNQQSIPSLLEYEAVLLDEYRKQTGCTKEPLYFLKNQLLSGNLRVYRFHARPHMKHEEGNVREHVLQTPPGLQPIALPKPVLQTSHGLQREPVLQTSHGLQREPVLQTSHGLQREPVLQILVKISGIWESNDSFGITYKFIDYTAT
jgi:hypothetical protein